MTDTTREAVETRCAMMRMLRMGFIAQWPNDPRFLRIFDEDIALMLALLARAEAAERTLEAVLAKVRREHGPAERVCEAAETAEFWDALAAWRAAQAQKEGEA
jgi:hypothetical protein